MMTRSIFFYKVSTSLLISSSTLYLAEVNSESQSTALRVELNIDVGKDISIHETFKDFSEAGDRLDCNRQYTPKVTASFSGLSKSDSGAMLLYGSKTNSI